MLKKHKIVLKKWGSERWIANELVYCGKILTVNKGFRSSKHFHIDKAESFAVLTGWLQVEIWPRVGKEGAIQIIDLSGYGSDTLYIPPLTPHRFRSMVDQTEVLEVSTHHSDSDSYRTEPSSSTL